MKWIKTSIGEVGIVEAKGLGSKKAIKKIPKGARIMKPWEYLKLIDEENDKLTWDLSDVFWTQTNGVARACYLISDHDFLAVGRYFDYYSGAVRGVLVVKKRRGRT